MLVFAIAFAACATHSSKDPMPSKVLFMCPFGGAKSVIAASYFNRAASEQHLPYVAVAAAAAEPYNAVPDPVANELEHDGFNVRDFKPRHVDRDELRDAAKVVAIDCDLTSLDTRGVTVERWDDVPKVSEDLPGSIASIRRHVDALIAALRRK